MLPPTTSAEIASHGLILVGRFPVLPDLFRSTTEYSLQHSLSSATTQDKEHHEDRNWDSQDPKQYPAYLAFFIVQHNIPPFFSDVIHRPIFFNFTCLNKNWIDACLDHGSGYLVIKGSLFPLSHLIFQVLCQVDIIHQRAMHLIDII
jgi:hypothetical protein